MKLRIQKIADEGNLEKERIVIKVVAKTDIGVYTVFQVDTEQGKITSDVQDAFWFPDQPVSVNDTVVLYTKQGVNKSRPSETGGKLHFFYWGKKQSKWNSNWAPVLLFISDWEVYNASEANATFSIGIK
ncbi:MAG: hypothetical protein WBG50_08255 [Desulfomonilaceae bacterium]